MVFFLIDYPSALMSSGKFAKVPALMGVTTDELALNIPTNLNISNDNIVLQLFHGKFVATKM